MLDLDCSLILRWISMYSSSLRGQSRNLLKSSLLRCIEFWLEGLSPFWDGHSDPLHAIKTIPAGEVGTAMLEADVQLGLAGFEYII
jgi:hypothetical protein